MAAPGPDISLVKKIFFYVVILLFMAVILELFVYVFLKVKLDSYSFSSLIETRNRIVGDNVANIVTDPSLVVLHPYLGYVYDPTQNSKGLTSHHGGFSVSDYGFIDDHSPFYKAKKDSVVIGIFGGSVAFFFSVFGVDSLVQQLESSPFFKDKDIEIVRLALGAYKQPQQLLALTYLLSLGAHFDVVINLDGFNEVALPAVNNISNNVSPFYPAFWSSLSNTVMNNQTKSLVGKLSYLRETRISYASMVNNSALHFSNIMNLIWLVIDKYLATAISVMQSDLSLSTVDHLDNYQLTGPKYAYADDLNMYRDLASHWSQSSQQMAKLCKENQILYWHFLQPNQHFQGSKVLSEEETKFAVGKESPYRNHAKLGYPVLIEAGYDLARSNLQFHDLTMIFKDHPESIYVDDCCHLNDTGNRILGDTIGNLIVEDIEKHGGVPKARSNLVGN